MTLKMAWLRVFTDCVPTITAPCPGGGHPPVQGADEVGEELGGPAHGAGWERGWPGVCTAVQPSLRGDIDQHAPGQPLWL